MAETIADEWRKARKAHRCIWCGESIIIGETYRHWRGKFEGEVMSNDWESRPPPTSDGGWRDTNRVWLCQEMGDVRAAMILLCDAGIVEKQSVHDYANNKLARVGRYLHHYAPILRK